MESRTMGPHGGLGIASPTVFNLFFFYTSFNSRKLFEPTTHSLIAISRINLLKFMLLLLEQAFIRYQIRIIPSFIRCSHPTSVNYLSYLVFRFLKNFKIPIPPSVFFCNDSGLHHLFW